MSKHNKSIYIVIKGHQPGVYTQWDGSDGANAQVEGFAGAVYRGFYNREEAANWLKSQPSHLLTPPLQRWLKEQSNQNADTLKDRVQDILQKGGIVIFIDGSSLGNPGRGGYGALIIDNQGQREISGGFRRTTNNRMELYACIAALESLRHPSAVLVITDSAYLYRATSEGWLNRWARSGWKGRDGKLVENIDLWQRLFRLCQTLPIEFYWIKGHNSTIENERCDRLATSAAQQPHLPEDTGYQRHSHAQSEQ